MDVQSNELADERRARRRWPHWGPVFLIAVVFAVAPTLIRIWNANRLIAEVRSRAALSVSLNGPGWLRERVTLFLPGIDEFHSLSSAPAGEVDDATLTAVVDLRAKIGSITLVGPKITREGLNELARIPGLSNLNLAGIDPSDEILEPVSRIAALSTLRVEGTQVTDRGLRAIGKLSRLRWLRLTLCDAGLDLTPLSACPELGRIHVPETVLTVAAAKVLAGFPKLERVYAFREPSTEFRDELHRLRPDIKVLVIGFGTPPDDRVGSSY